MPLPLAVARSNGNTWALVRRSTARRSASARPWTGADESPHGAGVSVQSVLACSPWLSSAALAPLPCLTAATSPSSRAGWPCRASWSASGTPVKVGSATLSVTSVSSSSAPS